MSLTFDKVTKFSIKSKKKKFILNELSFSIFNTDNLSIFCSKNKNAKKVLDLIASTSRSDSGKIVTTGNYSTLLGDTSDFHQQLTAEEYVRFKCKLYGEDFNTCNNYVREFSELDRKKYTTKSKNYDGFTRKKIAYGLELIFNFDTYLINGSIAFGPKEFQEKSLTEFKLHTKSSNFIISTPSLPIIRQYTNKLIILDQGASVFYNNITQGIEAIQNLTSKEKNVTK